MRCKSIGYFKNSIGCAFAFVFVLLAMHGCATSEPKKETRLKSIAVNTPTRTSAVPEKRAPVTQANTSTTVAQPAQPQKVSNDVGEEAFKLHSEAIASIRRKDWTTAELKLSRLIEQQPSLASPYANLGGVYLEMGRYSDARKMLSEAIARQKKNASFHNLIGVVYRQLGKFKEAEEAYNDALSVDPNYSAAYYNLGVLYDLYLINYSSAAKYYQRYAQLEPSEEKKVAGWIMDIQKRAQASN